MMVSGIRSAQRPAPPSPVSRAAGFLRGARTQVDALWRDLWWYFFGYPLAVTVFLFAVAIFSGGILILVEPAPHLDGV